MTPTNEQVAFNDWTLDALKSGAARTLIGDAVAGSGKSTTGALLMKSVSETLPEKSVVYLAFGKRNETDMTAKLARLSCPAKASTIHALGLRTCEGRLNVRRTQQILEHLDVCGKPWWFGLDRLFQAGQNQGYFCRDERGAFLDPGPSDWAGLAYDYDIDGLLPTKHKTDKTWRMIHGWMEKVCYGHLQVAGEVTYGDMVWLPLANEEIRGRIPKYDLVIVDEYQDLNVSRRIFANLCAASNGIRIFIGDARQAIMGFSGADTDAFASIRESQSCPVDTLTLSESFRVTQATATWARKYVPGFRAASSKPAGHSP